MIFQVTFSPQVDDWETITNTGLTFMYKLVDKNKSSFYVYQSTFWRYESGSVSWSTGMPYIEKYQENMFNVGLGFGLEYIAAERFSLNLMTGYGAFDNFEQFSLSVEAGIFYLF